MPKKRTPVLSYLYLPYNKWSVNEFSEYLKDFEAAISSGDLPRKNMPGYDYQQICTLDFERLWGPIVKELYLESEIEVTPQLLNGPVQQLLGVVKIVCSEQQQHSDPQSDRQHGGPQRDKLIPALRKLWPPYGVVPNHVSKPEIEQKVCTELKLQGVEDNKMPWRNTILATVEFLRNEAKRLRS